MEMQLSTSEIENLRKLQRNLAGSSDYARVTCILMLGMGNSPSFVALCLGIDVSTVYRYRSAYLHGGADELLENRHKGYWGLLDSRQLSALRKELREHIYTDAKSVAEWIKSTFGVEYTPQGVVDLLNRIGFTYKKTSEVPCEADASKQAAFVGELTEILSGMPEDAVVYYADGVHPTHNSRSTYAWIEKGEKLEQPTISGRDRVNINGLLNAHDVTDVIAHDCESVNAESTKEVYQAALDRHPEAPFIYIISDNALFLVIEENLNTTKDLANTRPYEFSDELVYTGITRCQNYLFIINTGNRQYHEYFSNCNLIDKKIILNG